jgi:hypothetical protein
VSPRIAVVTIPLEALCALVYCVHGAVGPLVSQSGPGPRRGQSMDTLTLTSGGLALAPPFSRPFGIGAISSKMPWLPAIVTQLITLTSSFGALLIPTTLFPPWIPFETLFALS